VNAVSDVVVLLCTVPPAQADAVVEPLLQEQLVACVNLVGPIRSRYRWQGAVEEGEEMLLILKTCRQLLPALQARLLQLHPYQVPELLELPVLGGLPAYLQWVRDSVRQTP
jgi:periplasmic divalent cation tolerance protein